MMSVQMLSAQTFCNLEDFDFDCLNSAPNLFKCGGVTDPVVTFSDLIDAEILLPVSQAQTMAQYIVIEGIVELDIPEYTFANGSEIIFAPGGPQNQLLIPAGKLSLKGTHVHGCTRLWRGINVTGTLEVTDHSVIEDAEYGIYLNQGAKLLCRTSLFTGNYIGIYAGAPLGAVSFGGAVIEGCTFSGTKDLLEGWNYSQPELLHLEKPREGIRLENVTQINIGGSNSLNKFEDFVGDIDLLPSGNQVCGIHAINSNVNVTKSQFENIVSNFITPLFQPQAAIGVFAENLGNPAIFTVTVNGNGVGAASPFTFRNCLNAVFARNYNLVASQILADRCNYGFFVRAWNNSVPNIFVANNRVLNTRETGVHAVFDQLGNGQNVAILNNDITFALPINGTAPGPHRGIFALGFTPTMAQSFQIVDNQITEEAENTTLSGFEGISLKSIRSAVISGNTVSEMNASSQGNKSFFGIQVWDSNNTTIENNSVQGNSTNYTPFYSFGASGIAVLFSAESEIACNTVDNVNQGITFFGTKCNPTNLNHNTFGTHGQGLALEEPTNIGHQDLRDNIWQGSSGQFEAVYKWKDFNPAIPFHTTYLQYSKFAISTAVANDLPNIARWANPRLIDGGTLTFDDSDNLWFEGDVNQTATMCSSSPPPPPGLTSTDEDVILGIYQPLKGHEATVWEAGFHTFHRLHRRPDLRPSNSAARSWYNDRYDSNLGKMARDYDAVTNLGISNASIETNKTLLDNLLGQLNTKNGEWSMAATASEKAQIEQEIAGLNQSVLDVQDDLAALIVANEASENNTRQSIVNDLNSLTLATEYEQDLRMALAIPLVSAISGQGYSSAQQSSLTTIAEKCRIAGGFGVAIARIALNYTMDKTAADFNCEVDPRSGLLQQIEQKASLYPNPTSGAFTLKWAEKSSTAQIRLLDLFGRAINQWEIEDAREFSNSGFPMLNGTYFLELRLDGQKPENHRLIISN